MLNSGLSRSCTNCTVSVSWARPLRAITCASTGTRTSLVETRALTVSTPKVGGQSMSTESQCSSVIASRLRRRIVSAPTSPARNFSTPTNHDDEGTTSTPATLVLLTTSKRLPFSTNMLNMPLYPLCLYIHCAIQANPWPSAADQGLVAKPGVASLQGQRQGSPQ